MPLLLLLVQEFLTKKMIKGQFPIEEFKSLRTPFYYYDMGLLRRTLEIAKSEMSVIPNSHMHYAIKANFNPNILNEIARSGFGADCVSGGEIKAAIKAGFKPNDIFFAGVGKSDSEIIDALTFGIGRFNVESLPELLVINDIASQMGKIAPVSLRVNPDIGAHTHANITTGLAENKFGINLEQLDDVVNKALGLSNIKFKGLHFHIGSQILDMIDFQALCNRINNIQEQFKLRGIQIEDINVGGGLGINYEHPNHLPIANFHDYFETYRKCLNLGPEQHIHFELGRALVAPCGSLICRVLYVKEGTYKRFAIVDGSMTELIRPALYHAYHRVENISSDEPEVLYDVVGPVCESSDVFAKGIMVDKCHRGDFVAIRSAGAYGESMASHYNCREFSTPFAYYG